tara:strand:- start:335 stop:517 length:183 start_codon:yes stop_codon:yes gene_type:complete
MNGADVLMLFFFIFIIFGLIYYLYLPTFLSWRDRREEKRTEKERKKEAEINGMKIMMLYE